MANARKCFDIGNKFSSDEFDAVNQRAMEYSHGKAPSNQDYSDAAHDIIHESQLLLDKIKAHATINASTAVPNVRMSRSRAEMKAGADGFGQLSKDEQYNYSPYEKNAPYHVSHLAIDEARKMLPKPVDKLKRVKSGDYLSQDFDWVANVDGEYFGITKYEDPDYDPYGTKDEVDEEDEGKPETGKWVYAYQRLDDDRAMPIETTHFDKEQLFHNMREFNKLSEQEAQEQYKKPNKSSIRFSRSTTHPISVQEAMDMARTGVIPYSMTEAWRRDQYAAAIQAAKDPNERKSALRSMTDSIIKTFADSMIPVKRWIEGIDVSPALKQRLVGDLYRAETVRGMLEREYTAKYIDPMFKKISETAKSTKMTTDQVKKLAGMWMSAKYSPKANQMLINKDRAELVKAQRTGDIAKINEAQRNLNERLADVNGPAGAPKMRGVGGGMNNAEAAKIKSDIEAKIPLAQLNEIAQHVYDMLEAKKNMDISNGKVTATMANSWANHDDYVPLTGDPRYTGEDSDFFGGAGNQVNQSSDKAMNGRKDSYADDGIDASIEAVLKSINHAGFQDFKRSLNQAYEEAQAAGKDIGLVREPVKGFQRLGDDAVIFRDTAVAPNGRESTKAHSFRFADRNVVTALKKGNMEHLVSVMNLLGKGTSFYGRLVTQFMPMFAPINFVRDIWERSEIMRVRKILDANGIELTSKQMDAVARKAIANSINPELWKATTAKSFGRNVNMQGPRGYLEELIRLGGLSTYSGWIGKSATEIEDAARNKHWAVSENIHKVTSFVENYNNSFEMVPSLAIHMALREAGVSAKDAAAFTLDLMNFRKRGTAMPAIRAMYAFAQPNATSAYNLAQYLSTRKGQVRFAAQLLFGMALYALLKAEWGDDEDEELGNKLDNVSNYITDRSIPLKVGGTVVKVPVGFGPPQMAWMLGTIVDRLQSGRYTAGDAIGEASKAWAKSMVPVSPSDIEISKNLPGFIAQSITPTVLKPFFNIYADQTSLGAGLTPQFKDPNKMKFQQAKNNTPQLYSDVAKSVYEMTGVDLYPDHIKALMDGYMIGPVHELMNTEVNNPARVARGEPPQLPLVHSLVDNINDRQSLNTVYSRYRSDLEEANRKFEYLKKEDPTEITPELRTQAQAFKQFAAAEKTFAQQRLALKKQTGLDPEIHDMRLQGIEERADMAKRRVLTRYIDATQ